MVPPIVSPFETFRTLCAFPCDKSIYGGLFCFRSTASVVYFLAHALREATLSRRNTVVVVVVVTLGRRLNDKVLDWNLKAWPSNYILTAIWGWRACQRKSHASKPDGCPITSDPIYVGISRQRDKQEAGR